MNKRVVQENSVLYVLIATNGKRAEIIWKIKQVDKLNTAVSVCF